MRRQQSKPLTGLASLRHFVILAAVLSAVVIYAGCNPQQSDNGNKAGTPGPTPGPVQKKDFSDTPIVISGGSVQLDFSHTLFNGSSGTYTVTDNVLSEGSIYDNSPGNNPKPDISLPIPANGYCTITVRGKAPGGQTADLIKIESKTAPNSVAITFNEGNYPRRKPRSNLHSNRNDQIEEVVVTDKNPGGQTVTFNQQNGLPANGKITIEIFGRH